MTRYSETPQHKWRFRINMTLRNILLHFEFSNKTLDLKCATLSIISTWGSCVEMKRISHLHISHNTPCLPPSSPAPPPKQKYCVTFGFFLSLLGITAFPGETENNACAKFWGQTRCIWYLRRCGIGDHPLCPRVFSFSNMAVTGRAENPYYYVAC